MHDGGVDAETARTQMLKMLAEYQHIVGGSRFKTVARYAAKVVPVLAPLSHLLGVPDLFSVAGDVAGGGAPLIAEWLLPEPKPNDRVRPAALVYEARRFFGSRH